MGLYGRLIRKIAYTLHLIPGEKYLKEFRFLPVFFVTGAALEFVMIKLHVGEVNFYKTFKKRMVADIVELRLRELEAQGTTTEQKNRIDPIAA